jgi:hypothetical protein
MLGPRVIYVLLTAVAAGACGSSSTNAGRAPLPSLSCPQPVDDYCTQNACAQCARFIQLADIVDSFCNSVSRPPRFLQVAPCKGGQIAVLPPPSPIDSTITICLYDLQEGKLGGVVEVLPGQSITCKAGLATLPYDGSCLTNANNVITSYACVLMDGSVLSADAALD